MSIANLAISESAIAAHSGGGVPAVRKPPTKRSIVAKADSGESPEPR